MGCIAPSEILDRVTSSRFGSLAEWFIGDHYLRYVGRSSRYPVNPYDFQDFSAGFANVTLLTTFLQDHNPTLNTGRLLSFRRQRRMFRVPDLLTDERPLLSTPPGFPVPPAGRARMEYYEIKPNSPSGWADGADKIAGFAALCAFFRMPYYPGVSWNPDVKHTLFSGCLYGVQVEVYFHFFRTAPGLIVYQVCLEQRGLLELAQITLIIAVVILMILAKGRIPLRAIRLPGLPIPQWIPGLT